MGKVEETTKSVAICYLPYFGFFTSLYFILTEKKSPTDTEEMKRKRNYSRFHIYHGLFFGLLVFAILLGIQFLMFISLKLPFIGTSLVSFLSIINFLTNVGIFIASSYFTIQAYKGLPFSIPLLTEYTNNFMENRKMLT